MAREIKTIQIDPNDPSTRIEYTVTLTRTRSPNGESGNGKKVNAISIPNKATVDQRLAIFAQEYGTNPQAVLSVLGTLEDLIFEGPNYALGEETIHRYEGRQVNGVFVEWLGQLGISQTHAQELIRQVAYPAVQSRNQQNLEGLSADDVMRLEFTLVNNTLSLML